MSTKRFGTAIAATGAMFLLLPLRAERPLGEYFLGFESHPCSEWTLATSETATEGEKFGRGLYVLTTSRTAFESGRGESAPEVAAALEDGLLSYCQEHPSESIASAAAVVVHALAERSAH